MKVDTPKEEICGGPPKPECSAIGLNDLGVCLYTSLIRVFRRAAPARDDHVQLIPPMICLRGHGSKIYAHGSVFEVLFYFDFV